MPLGVALAAFLHTADAAAQQPAPTLGDIIAQAQALKTATLGDLIGTALEMKRKAADAAAHPHGPTTDTLIEKAQDLKRRHAKDAPIPLPLPSIGRIVEQTQALKRRRAEQNEARDREAAALIQQVDRGPSPLEIEAQKDAFIRDRLDPMLGGRKAFLIHLDERIRRHGILAFVAGLDAGDKAICAELIGITEEQRKAMESRPDLFNEDDLHSNLVLSALLKILAE